MKRWYGLAAIFMGIVGVNASRLWSGWQPSPSPGFSAPEIPAEFSDLGDLPDISLPEPPSEPVRQLRLYGDTNRDGVVRQTEDLEGRDRWSWQQGTLLPFNHDDDNLNGIPDWQDSTPGSLAGDRELALFRLDVPERWQNKPVYLQSNAAARPYLRAFQRTHQGWRPVDLSGMTPLTPSSNLVLGIEASQFAQPPWNGYARLAASVRENGETLARDRIAVRVTPWLMLSNAAKPQEIYVSPDANSRFLPQLQQQADAAGLPLTVDSSQLLWMQDTMEIGFVQFPSRGRVQVIPSVLNGVRDERLDGFSRSLLKPDFGWFSVAEPRELPDDDAWLDWYGNLEVTPPLPDYPLGRIYYGVADDRQFHPKIAAFLDAQELQTPAFTIDTSWLYIRHVDEVLSFVPNGEGSFRVLLTSPEAGVEFLRELAQQGYGDLTLARGLSGERTINEFLADTEAVEHNLQLQAQHVDAIAAKLKQELQLSDDRIVRVPALYGELGDSIFPNLVNLVVLGDRLLVSDPQGPLVNGRDALQEEFRRLVTSTGRQVAFLDDAEYHELKGNLHCATNVRRQGTPQPFWQQLTAP